MEGDARGQKWTTWFLWKEGVRVTEIYRRLADVCGEKAPARSTVFHWVQNFESGHECVEKGVSSGRPATSRTSAAIETVSKLIMADRRITFTKLQNETGLGRATLHEIIHEDLKMRKICARWVPHQLTEMQKKQRVDLCRELMRIYNTNRENFFKRLVTGDESWFLFETPEKKRQSMEWKHTASPPSKKPRPSLTPKKQMATVFWDEEGIVLLDWLPTNETVNSDTYCETLRKLRRSIQQRRQGKWALKVLLQHDNARPHTSRKTTDALATMGFTKLPHPTHSPDLAPSDYALFDKMKDALRGRRMSSTEELQDAVRDWCRSTPKEWFYTAIRKLPEKWERCIELGGDYL